MNWLNRIAAILTVPMITVAAAGSATAEAYPSKPIDMIVTWNAGGSTDVIARLMAGPLGKRLGEPVAVANRVGGGGSLGTRAALHAPKDGYTILMTTSGNHILTPLKHDVGYRYDDFTPVGQLFSGTIILAVRADSPWKSLDQLVKAAKARPNKYTFGAVSGVMPYLDLESLAHTAGFKVVHVPEQGGAPGAIALLAGDIDMLPANAATVSANIKAGKMRALAVFNEKRDPAFPNVPTATEQGYPVIGSPFVGVAVAKGVPKDRVEKLRKAVAAVAKDPKFQQRALKAGMVIDYQSAEKFGNVWARDWKTYAPMLRKK